MKIFITRELSEEGVFFQTLTDRGHQVHGESLVTFFPVPVGGFPPVDWIFFYSQTGVRFFFKQFSPEKTEGIRLACLGRATASLLEKTCRPPDFTGDGDPQRTADAFLPLATGQQVLFPQAKDSRQSIRQLIEDEIVAHDLVVYDNRARTDFALPDFDCLVFTSPLNVKAWFAKKSLKPLQKVVAIGNTTAAALTELGIKKIVVAQEPSEEALSRAILKMEN